VLQSAGNHVGLYTSPHLHHLGERIQINGAPLPLSALHALVELHKDAILAAQQVEQGRLSHFEVTTALAFRYGTQDTHSYATAVGLATLC
jgi:folylpolyglutamate synthase/dihydropteroate synthase